MNWKRLLLPGILAAYGALCVYTYLAKDNEQSNPSYGSSALTGLILLGLIILAGYVIYRVLYAYRFKLLYAKVTPTLEGTQLVFNFKTIAGWSHKEDIVDLSKVAHILVNKSHVEPADYVEFWSADPKAQYQGQRLTQTNPDAILVGRVNVDVLHGNKALREQLTELLRNFYGTNTNVAPDVNLSTWESTMVLPQVPEVRVN